MQSTGVNRLSASDLGSLVLAKSTEKALEKLSSKSFDAIISDMGPPPDPRAGYTLLDKLRAKGDQTPFIIYAGSRAPEHREEAIRHGAVGCTNRPDELFEMVLMALGGRRERLRTLRCDAERLYACSAAVTPFDISDNAGFIAQKHLFLSHSWSLGLIFKNQAVG